MLEGVAGGAGFAFGRAGSGGTVAGVLSFDFGDALEVGLGAVEFLTGHELGGVDIKARWHGFTSPCIGRSVLEMEKALVGGDNGGCGPFRACERLFPFCLHPSTALDQRFFGPAAASDGF